MIESWSWMLVVLPLFALAMTLFNLVFWPQGRRQPPATKGRASVLLPARNEERSIEASVQAVLANGQSVAEVLVCDDHSTDRTADLLRELSVLDNRVRVLQGRPLPEGWVGKPNACAQLAEQAKSDVLLFVDADVQLDSSGVDRILEIMGRYDADVVTAVPHQKVETWAEKLVVPLLYATYTAWLPLPLIWRSRDPRFLAANGQILAVKRTTYDAIGGFDAVRHEVVDDMAFCANAKRHGHRVVFADGERIATCRMYQGFEEVWKGFSKNLYEGVGGLFGVLVVFLLYLSAFVIPYLALVASIWIPSLLLPAGIAVAANVALRAGAVFRNGQAPSGLLHHPLGVCVLLGIALNSVRWARLDQIEWRGRSYARRSRRTSVGVTK